jgi:hypothetical protein
MGNLRIRILVLVVLVAFLASLAAADNGGNGRHVRARLVGFEEVPALSTDGEGRFDGTFDHDGEELAFELGYEDLTGNVTQAHIHLGQRSVNGGISIFLCSNLGNGPAGTPACPAAPAEISGIRTAADVIGPTGQGVAAEEWEEVKRAMREGATYVNVHTDLFPAGEIRGQLRTDRRRDD